MSLNSKRKEKHKFNFIVREEEMIRAKVKKENSNDKLLLFLEMNAQSTMLAVVLFQLKCTSFLLSC